MKNDIKVLFNGYELDLNSNTNLGIALNGLLHNDPDKIHFLSQYVIDNLDSFRTKSKKRIEDLTGTLFDSIFYIECQKNPQYAASVRAKWEKAFKGYKLSSFAKIHQDFYLELCKIAPVPMEYNEPVEIGIENDVDKAG
jgi:hypothetical protein